MYHDVITIHNRPCQRLLAALVQVTSRDIRVVVVVSVGGEAALVAGSEVKGYALVVDSAVGLGACRTHECHAAIALEDVDHALQRVARDLNNILNKNNVLCAGRGASRAPMRGRFEGEPIPAVVKEEPRACKQRRAGQKRLPRERPRPFPVALDDGDVPREGPRKAQGLVQRAQAQAQVDRAPLR